MLNHQRMLPPMERNNPAYTSQQVKDAEIGCYTLVTTWDLFRTARLFQEKIITFKDIHEALHTPGLFSILPSATYTYIGKTENLLKDGFVPCFLPIVDAC